jgi:hypothetical protein
MERELRDELEVPGYAIGYFAQPKHYWLKQAKDTMDRAAKYGATTPNEMKEEDKKDLREALIALGQKVSF